MKQSIQDNHFYSNFAGSCISSCASGPLPPRMIKSERLRVGRELKEGSCLSFQFYSLRILRLFHQQLSSISSGFTFRVSRSVNSTPLQLN